jgi:hypothetical protein
MTQKEIVLNLFKSKRFVTIRDIELSGIIQHIKKGVKRDWVKMGVGF